MKKHVINNQQDKGDYQVTTNEIMDFLKENMVVKTELQEVKIDLQEVKTELQEGTNQLRKEMKQEIGKLKQDIGKLKLDLIDVISEKNAELRGDIILLTRKEDKKVVNLIELLREKKLITKNEAKSILILEPFPQLFLKQ